MEYKTKDTGYEVISPGTIGVSQKISSDCEYRMAPEFKKETGKLGFLAKNEVRTCTQNQY